MSRSMQNHSSYYPETRSLDSQKMNIRARAVGVVQSGSGVAALSIEFVAKPGEAHKVQSGLPSAISGSLGELDGFAGSFVMISNHEARLVTVVSLWSGEDRLRQIAKNERWVRALLAPYLDRCLRVQILAAYGTDAPKTSKQFEPTCSHAAPETELMEEEAICVA